MMGNGYGRYSSYHHHTEDSICIKWQIFFKKNQLSVQLLPMSSCTPPWKPGSSLLTWFQATLCQAGTSVAKGAKFLGKATPPYHSVELFMWRHTPFSFFLAIFFPLSCRTGVPMERACLWSPATLALLLVLHCCHPKLAGICLVLYPRAH